MGVIVGGISQGGTVAAHAALSCKQTVGAVLMMRSLLLDATQVDSKAAKPPVFVFQAQHDAVYLNKLQTLSLRRLKKHGIKTDVQVGEGLSHENGGVLELQWAAGKIASV